MERASGAAMTQTLDLQLVDRFCECVIAHDHAPVHTAPITYGFDLPSALGGHITHIMYAKDGKLMVAWFRRSPAVQHLFDAYGT
jgi:hypothetical protein